MALNEHQRRSRRQERDTAAEFGGRRNPGSGNTPLHGNDVRTDLLSIECKTTTAKGYRLTLDELQAAERHALLDGREMAFIIDIKGHEYAVVTKDFLLELLDS